MTISKEQIRQWVEALRSGEYKQGKGHLHSKGGYCCLGVFAKAVLGYKDSYLSREKEGPVGVYTKLEGLLGSRLRATLTDMNDKGKGFNKIADFIESELK